MCGQFDRLYFGGSQVQWGKVFFQNDLIHHIFLFLIRCTSCFKNTVPDEGYTKHVVFVVSTLSLTQKYFKGGLQHF